MTCSPAPSTRSDDRAPVVSNIDTSRIKAGDPRFLAAVMIAAWSDIYGMVEADQALADEGLAPRRRYCLTLDELWRVLRLGGTMPDRVNELTRLNRTQGVGQIMITHSLRDLTPTQNQRRRGHRGTRRRADHRRRPPQRTPSPGRGGHA